MPLAHALVTGMTRRRQGRKPDTLTFFWQAVAVATGMALTYFEDRQRQAVIGAHDENLAARRNSAHLAGQGSVAFGADTLVDLLMRTEWLMRDPTTPPVGARAVAAWRLSLVAEATQHSVFLGDALKQWSRRHNLHPDLSSHVFVTTSPDDGTALLTATQASALARSLDQLELVGATVARLDDSDNKRSPGHLRRLHVGSHVIDIQPDTTVVRPFDPGPILFAVQAGWLTGSAFPAAEAVPWPLAGLNAGAAVGAAIWAQRLQTRRGEQASQDLMRVGIALGAANALVTRWARLNRLAPTGTPLPTQMQAFTLPMMVRLLYGGGVPAPQRRQITRTIFGVQLALALLERPTWRSLELTLWVIPPLLAVSQLTRAAPREADRLASELAEQDRAELDKAFTEGRDSMVALVAIAKEDAAHRLSELESRLPERVVIEIRRRLDEIDRRLEALSWTSSTPYA